MKLHQKYKIEKIYTLVIVIFHNFVELRLSDLPSNTHFERDTHFGPDQ